MDILTEEQRRAADVAAALDRFEGRTQIRKRISYTHDAMIDILIREPFISQNELAEVFGYSPAWISIVLNSDMFQARLAARKEEVVNPVLRASLEERLRGIVVRSMEVLQDKLSKDAGQVPDNLALRALELGAKAMGLGGNAPPAPPSVPTDHLANMAERLVALQSQARRNLPYVQDVSEAVPHAPAAHSYAGGPGEDALQAGPSQG